MNSGTLQSSLRTCLENAMGTRLSATIKQRLLAHIDSISVTDNATIEQAIKRVYVVTKLFVDERLAGDLRSEMRRIAGI